MGLLKTLNKSELASEYRQATEKGMNPCSNPTDAPASTRPSPGLVSFCSNNYLGLATDDRVKDAAINAVKLYGTSSSGSRILSGTGNFHLLFESNLRNALGYSQQAGVVTGSGGYATIVGLTSALLKGTTSRRGNLIVLDDEIHASVADGSLFSGCRIKRFNHNDPNSLNEVLSWAENNRYHGKIGVGLEGIYSMGGDVLNNEVLEVCMDPKWDASIIIDDAHALGVLADGAGSVRYFKLEERLRESEIMTVGTGSKCLSSLGGFGISEFPDAMNAITLMSRPNVFSAAASPADVAAANRALEIMLEEPERRTTLLGNANKLRQGFQEIGYNTGSSKETPIIPLIIGDDDRTMQIWKHAKEQGVVVSAVTRLAVPPGQSRIRVTASYDHTKEDIDLAIRVLGEAYQKYMKE